MEQRVLIYGYGAMASAMVEGWLASGIAADRFTIYNPRPKPVPDGTTFTQDIPDKPFDVVVLGFKPHMLGDIAPDMQACVAGETTVLSILAGIELSTLVTAFPAAGAVVRFMPNLAVALGKSPNALYAVNISEEKQALVSDLAERLGTAEWLEDESRLGSVSALTASGPGFVYRFIDALAAGAVSLGLEREQADRLAVQMVEGAAALASHSPESPGILAARVASPGGMTQKGLDVLDADQALNKLIEETLRAARDRAAEMAADARKNG